MGTANGQHEERQCFRQSCGCSTPWHGRASTGVAASDRSRPYHQWLGSAHDVLINSLAVIRQAANRTPSPTRDEAVFDTCQARPHWLQRAARHCLRQQEHHRADVSKVWLPDGLGLGEAPHVSHRPVESRTVEFRTVEPDADEHHRTAEPAEHREIRLQRPRKLAVMGGSRYCRPHAMARTRCPAAACPHFAIQRLVRVHCVFRPVEMLGALRPPRDTSATWSVTDSSTDTPQHVMPSPLPNRLGDILRQPGISSTTRCIGTAPVVASHSRWNSSPNSAYTRSRISRYLRRMIASGGRDALRQTTSSRATYIHAAAPMIRTFSTTEFTLTHE